ncbi:hypothetical protein AGLY_004454 [Aphis glycines]|uniref:Uncharacterized protein n=1 Tax=Aphis glycines TaxID=307491 RepID=A0A6G0TY39_APHGL|nr:hypothetical protein AGLY_004454 [Aphis glycines]
MLQFYNNISPVEKYKKYQNIYTFIQLYVKQSYPLNHLQVTKAPPEIDMHMSTKTTPLSDNRTVYLFHSDTCLIGLSRIIEFYLSLKQALSYNIKPNILKMPLQSKNKHQLFKLSFSMQDLILSDPHDCIDIIHFMNDNITVIKTYQQINNYNNIDKLLYSIRNLNTLTETTNKNVSKTHFEWLHFYSLHFANKCDVFHNYYYIDIKYVYYRFKINTDLNLNFSLATERNQQIQHNKGVGFLHKTFFDILDLYIIFIVLFKNHSKGKAIKKRSI